jgi:hypothetical protein
MSPTVSACRHSFDTGLTHTCPQLGSLAWLMPTFLHVPVSKTCRSLRGPVLPMPPKMKRYLFSKTVQEWPCLEARYTRHGCHEPQN